MSEGVVIGLIWVAMGLSAFCVVTFACVVVGTWSLWMPLVYMLWKRSRRDG